MRRRAFLALLGAAAALPLSWPLAARAQQGVRRIGVLLLSGPELMGSYREALRDIGYVEGRNIQFEVRSAQGQPDRLPELAAELVRSKVDIILSSLTPAIAAAKNATRDIPIVMAPAGDPVATGLISNLARPGGNITGLSGIAAELGAKSLELIREVVPAARRVFILNNVRDPFAKLMLEQVQRGAQVTHFDVRPIMMHGNDELEGAFATMVRERADVVILSGSLSLRTQADLALKHRLPSLHNQSSFARGGVLVSYGASSAERAREIARYVDRIFKGAKPADLPVQQPSMFELVINLKTATAIGLTISPTLLARADEVIE